MNQELKNNISLKERLAYAKKRGNGIPIEVNLNPYIKILNHIKEVDLSNRTDHELSTQSRDLRSRILQGENPDNLLVPVFALIKEACRRTIGLSPFDVQIIAGIAMHQGKLAQMQTGEGKTLAAVFPAVLNGLSGDGVHILTANDYLAKRDAEWMGPVYKFLGLTTGHIEDVMTLPERQRNYSADITYLTAKEAGFDYLRDQMRYNKKELAHRDFNFAIVDEADFILIDEARIPLVIAGSAAQTETDPDGINRIIPAFQPGVEFGIDKNQRNIYLTIEGQNKVQDLLDCGGMHEESSVHLYAAVNVALHAHHLLKKDVDYIVREGRIELVDEFTGRVADKRRWPYGIQNALEAKEGLSIQTEGRIYGSITIQHFVGLYPTLSGMTATAVPAAGEMVRFYGLGTVIIPPNKPVVRIDSPDVVFRDKESKDNAIAAEIARVHSTGQPILAGTASVEESQGLAERIRDFGISCNVLNAKNDAEEAELVAKAGMLGAVTISTNMAGRGTDIILGGPQGIDRKKIEGLGGLYVLGTNRHESVRVDNQLRGRAGRQGDRGISHFFVSLEDPIIEKYGILDFIPSQILQINEGQPVCDQRVGGEIEHAQSIIEDQNYQIRHTLKNYSELAENQRRYIQSVRGSALSDDILPEELPLLPGGDKKLKPVLTRIFLHYVDNFWADHLFFIDDLRQGIHLQRFGGKEPLLYFIKQVSDTFNAGIDDVYTKTVQTFDRVRSRGSGEDLAAEGIEGPSSTWTYLINDSPLPGFNLGLIAGGNMGFAALAALPMMILSPLFGLAKLLRNKKKT
jgi:preprotein translocase subunit SecA